jgi:hypothetical protein
VCAFSLSHSHFSHSLFSVALFSFLGVDNDLDDVNAADMYALSGVMIGGDGSDDMEHLPLPNVAMYRAECIWFIERRYSNVGVYRALIW